MYLKALERLTDAFNTLPSVGRKSAERMAYAILEMDESSVKEFANALLNVKNKIHKCPICGNLTENEICDICSDPARDKSTLLVVSYPKDVFAFEKTGEYKGLYHVLNGVISISKGRSIQDLNIASLLDRVKDGAIKEVVIATNPTIEGETTALYISKLIEKFGIKVTRIAYGVPMGGNLDYADAITLTKALQGRTKI